MTHINFDKMFGITYVWYQSGYIESQCVYPDFKKPTLWVCLARSRNGFIADSL